MAKKYLDYNGLQYFWQKIKSIIPNFTSDLTNDSGFVTTDDDIEWVDVDVLNGSGDDVWEFGGTIPLDLTTPVAKYEFASCSMWKKVRVLRLRPTYVSTLNSNVWFGVSTYERSGGGTGTNLTPVYIANGYIIQQVEMEYDNLGGVIVKSFSSNNGNAQASLDAAPYTSIDVEASVPATYRKGRIAPNSNWMFYAVDPAKAWDGTETYYWWGVHA